MSVFRHRKVLFGLLAGGLAAAALLIFLVLRPGSLRHRVERLWSGQGVEKPNLILVTLDTTRADHLACYGYGGVRTPNLDGLAERGVVFDQCATTAPLTLPAHSSIMTGMNPTYHGVRINGGTALPDSQTTLAEILTGRGYACGAFIGAFVLDGRWGLKQGFAHYDDYFDLARYKRIDLGYVQRPGNVVTDAALAWLEGEKGKPFFAWVHLYDPHQPYDPPEPFKSEYQDRGPVGLYDGEIAFADAQVGRLLEWLRANGLDKKTLVVVIGDHGESLGQHGEASHGFFIYDATLHVPFIITTPFDRFKGRRVSTQVTSVDVFPTVLDLLGVEGAPTCQGRSLLAEMSDPGKAKDIPAYSESMAPNIQYGWAGLHSLRSSRYKFVEAPRPELYDIVQDPGETRNILNDQPAVARAMKADLDRIIVDTSRNAPKPQAANLDRETTQRLAALGYIGGMSTKKVRGGTLADPKDKLAVFEAVQASAELIFDGKHAEAARRLEAILKEDPNASQALLLLSQCYIELGRDAEAQAALDVILRDDPENTQALIFLANILTKSGKGEDAIAVCKRALAVDPNNSQAGALIGEVYLADKKNAEALPYLEKAVGLQPKLGQNNLNLAACLIGLKKYDRAETLLNAVLKDTPKFPMAQFNLGLLYEEQGRWAEARRAYETELQNFPKDFEARFNLGKILLREGDREGYLDAMREVMAQAPNRPEGYLFLARGLMAEPGPLDEVQGLVEKGLSLAQTADLKALGYFLQADIYSRKNQPDKMRAALEKANSFKSKEESKK
jgi:choline-sulfatase